MRDASDSSHSPSPDDLHVIEALPHPVFICDGLGRIMVTNSAFRRLLDLPQEAQVSTDCQLPVHPEDRARYLRDWDACLETGRVFRQQLRIRSTGDDWCWMELTATPRFSPHGDFAAVVGMLIDITAVRQADEIRATLAAIVSAADDAIVSKTLDGIIRSWNAGAERIFGYTAEEAVGRPITMIIPPELQHQERAILSRLRLGERIEHFETVRVAKDGRRLDISLTVSPVRDREGRIVGASKIARDITLRRQGDRAQSLLAAIVASSDDAIISKTLDGVILTWNAAAERLFGYAAAEIIGQPIATIIPQERLDEERQIIARLRQGERIEHFETVRMTREGRHIDVSLTVSPIHDAAGAVIGASKIARDITEKKRAERLLQQSTEALEQANSELERFVAIASHDLKEPLRGMRLLASLLLEDEANISDEGRVRLERLRTLSERLTAMINGLLEYARTAQSRDEVAHQPCDLEQIIRAAVDKIADRLQAENAEVIIHGPLPMIQGDAVLLERLFGNLIVNGIRHNNSQRKRIEIATDAGTISVRDNGIGIDPKHHAKLFGLFQRLRGDGERPGLGLALAHNIVRLHRGRIWVQSQEGQGATFFVHFPKAVLPHSMSEPPSRSVG